MTLAEEIDAIAAAIADAGSPATLTAVLPAEASTGDRRYVCSFEDDAGLRRWLIVDRDARPVADRREARDAVSIAVLCELAAESAFPGDLDELRGQLVALRITEAPAGIEEAEAAVATLQRTLGTPPTLADPTRLDEIGRAALELERALDPTVPSPFTSAMRSAQSIVDQVWGEVEREYLAGFID